MPKGIKLISKRYWSFRKSNSFLVITFSFSIFLWSVIMENFYSFFLTLYYAYTSIKLPPSYQAFMNQRFDFIYRKQSFILTGDEAYNRLVEVFPDFLIRINGRNVRNFIKFDVTNLNDFMFNSVYNLIVLLESYL